MAKIKSRDDFNQITITTLKNRAGNMCSNPGCQNPTSGPRSTGTKAINVGVAAHISAAAPGGPRFDPFYSPAERADINNGIWLCQTCSKLIDNDEEAYTGVVLRGWKLSNEDRAKRAIESPRNEVSVKTEKMDTAYVFSETIELALDDSYMGTDLDLRNLAARMAIRFKEETKVRVVCRYPDFDNVVADDSRQVPGAFDSVQLADAKRSKRIRGSEISRAIELLFSEACHSTWATSLQSVDDWFGVLKNTISSYAERYSPSGSKKIDVWRTDEPAIAAAIYLGEAEVREMLEELKLEKIEYLAFGSHWKAADELPRNIILSKVIPRLARAIASANLDSINAEVLELSSWHIGQG